MIKVTCLGVKLTKGGAVIVSVNREHDGIWLSRHDLFMLIGVV